MMLRTVFMHKRQELPQPEEEKLPLGGQDVKIKNFEEFTTARTHKHTCTHMPPYRNTLLLL